MPTAINQRTKRSIECHRVPDNVRSNFPEVKYIIVHSNFTTCLYKTHKPIEQGLEYAHYMVEGEMYNSFNTLPLNQIKSKDNPEQMSMF